MKIEIALDSIEAAITAVEAGADRLEVCGPLSIGGVTPSIGLVIAIDQVIADRKCTTQQRVMIRSRGGNFEYSPSEWRVMVEDIRSIAGLNLKSVTGFVLGSINDRDELPLAELNACCQAAPNHKFTFHRAVDLSTDEATVVRKILRELPQFDTILTSGGALNVTEGGERLGKLIAEFGAKIMPGSGVNLKTIPGLKAAVGAQGTGPDNWMHASCPKKEVPAEGRAAQFGFGSRYIYDRDATIELVRAIHGI